ncbi:MAG: heavy metal translocating P-type ATPase [Geminicoccaceae bacterium]
MTTSTLAFPSRDGTDRPGSSQVKPEGAAFMVENAHCGGCLRKIEREIAALPGITSVRFNLTTRRLAVQHDGSTGITEMVAERLAELGFPGRLYDPDALTSADSDVEKKLLRAMTVAGFAAANVMLLSVSVWAGSDMGPATRSLLHWFSALIVLPAVVYAGRPFFESALRAVARRQTNMDVPISLAIVLASGMSLFETIRGGEHVYFESAIMLLFFLLLGRYLDRRARGKARHAAESLLTLDQTAITVIQPDGGQRLLPSREASVGMKVLVAAGERIGVDGKIVSGRSEADTSLITGETVPVMLNLGDRVFAGTLNMAAPIEVEITAVGEGTLLAEIVRLMEVAEQRRGRYVVLADRIAGWYAPVVHGLALATFLGWTLFAGAAWQTALLYAISVLIITCPCALGLAVPAVQVIASGRLLKQGVLLKSGTALERLAQVTIVVFDKTGTLTEGRPTLRHDKTIKQADLQLAASLAATSRHPLAKAIAAAASAPKPALGVEEVPGMGLRLTTDHGEVRLGNRHWCDVASCDADADSETGPELWLATSDGRRVRFAFDDPLRVDSGDVIGELESMGISVAMLSGDRTESVGAVADKLGIVRWRARCTPSDKVEHLEQCAAEEERVLMVGDGLNDAAALSAAHVSLSPATAIDVSQAAADAVFQGRKLEPVHETLTIARRASRMVKQNLALALGYNAFTIPLAVAGLVTPLIAAICMSASSLIVVGNALRLGRGGREWTS